MQMDCHELIKHKQVVKAYALDVVSTSPSAPSAKKKGKGINIQYIFSVCGIPISVLFDTKASHSFISSDLVDRFGLKPIIVDRYLIVTNLVRGPISLRIDCYGLVIVSHKCSFVCDFFILGFCGVYYHLEDDWLRKYMIVVHCKKLLVMIRVEDR